MIKDKILPVLRVWSEKLLPYSGLINATLLVFLIIRITQMALS